jgi:molybdopterin converting factor small subunit
MALVHLLCFGQLAEIVTQTTITSTDLNTLKNQLETNYPNLKNYIYSIAVNEQILTACVLNDNDTVALLPAFSGG